MSFIPIGSCNFKKFGPSRVAVDEGRGLETKIGVSLEACKKLCDQDPACNSFAYCNAKYGNNGPMWPTMNPPGCFTKEKVLTGKEPKRKNKDCTTYFATTCRT